MLPKKWLPVFAHYPYEWRKYLMEEEDFFMELVLRCKETDSLSGDIFLKRVYQAIDTLIQKQRQEAYKLYNPYRNLYLDKCYGDSQIPLGE